MLFYLPSFNLLTPGFSYPSDKTLSPEASIPNELNVRDYQTLFSVSILSGGRNFQTPPNVILYNPSTNEVVPDFQGSTELAGNSVSPTVDGVPGVRIDKNPVGLEDDVVYEAYKRAMRELGRENPNNELYILHNKGKYFTD